MNVERDPVVSVIIPVFNEEEAIGDTLQRTLQLSDRLNLEVIVVDDGSTDRTCEIVRGFKKITLVSHQNNQGKGKALVTGILRSRGRIVVIQDADLEYSPEEIPKLVEPILRNGADAVFGSRFLGKIDGMSHSHWFGNRILSIAASLLYGVSISDVMTGHKAFLKKSLRTLKLNENGFEVEVELTAKLLRNGWKLAEVPTSYSYRRKGLSKIGYLDGLRCLAKLVVFRIGSVTTS